MNQTEREYWREEVLQFVLKAMSESEELTDALVFKGAWVLNYHLQTTRRSRDIDTNLSSEFVFRHPETEEQRIYLEHWIRSSVGGFFENQAIVRYQLDNVIIEHSEHPMGWNSFTVRLRISDNAKASVLGLPSLEIDIASPEELSDISITNGALGSRLARAYSLERIAGEKARAFLSSLPTYCKKLHKPHTNIRVKDLYDLVRIGQARPLSNVSFWTAAGHEFERACRSRFVDCFGWLSFAERWAEAEVLFTADPTLPKDVRFDEVADLLPRIVATWEVQGVIPLLYDLP